MAAYKKGVALLLHKRALDWCDQNKLEYMFSEEESELGRQLPICFLNKLFFDFFDGERILITVYNNKEEVP